MVLFIKIMSHFVPVVQPIIKILQFKKVKKSVNFLDNAQSLSVVLVRSNIPILLFPLGPGASQSCRDLGCTLQTSLKQARVAYNEKAQIIDVLVRRVGDQRSQDSFIPADS